MTEWLFIRLGRILQRRAERRGIILSIETRQTRVSEESV